MTTHARIPRRPQAVVAFTLVAAGIVPGCGRSQPTDNRSQPTDRLDARSTESAACSGDLTTACARLQVCCAQLDNDDEDDEGGAEECEELVEEGDAAACEEAVEELCMSMDPTALPPAPDACARVESCCAQLDEDEQEDCEEAVEEGDAAACEEAIAEYCVSMGPSSFPPAVDACTQLTSCCHRLDDEDDQEDCEELLEDGDAAACDEGLAEFCE